MNGYILKPAKSPFTAKQLDMIARAKKRKHAIFADILHNMQKRVSISDIEEQLQEQTQVIDTSKCESEIDKVQAFDTNAASVQHVTDLVRKDLDKLIGYVPPLGGM